MPDATEILARMKAVCEAATKGQARLERGNVGDKHPLFIVIGDNDGARLQTDEDTQFYFAARTGWPATIRALEVARKALDRIVAETRSEADFITAGRARMQIDAILENRDA